MASEAFAPLEQLIAQAKACMRDHPGDALQLVESALQAPPTPAPPLLAQLRFLQGHALNGLGRHREALVALTGAAALAREIDLPAVLADCQRVIGGAWYRLGDYDQALVHFVAALDAAIAGGDVEAQCRSWCNVALVRMRLGDLDGAVAVMRECLSHPALTPITRAITLGNLGHADMMRGRPQDALPVLQEALALVESHGITGQRAGAHNALGQALVRAGRPHQALSLLEEGLRLARQTGNRRQQGQAHLGLGLAYQAMEDLLVARQHLETARQVARALDAPADELDACEALLGVLRTSSELDAALRCHDELRVLERRLHERRASLRISGLLSRLELQKVQHDAALTAVRNGELRQTNEELRVANASLRQALRRLGYGGTAAQAQALMQQAALTTREQQVLCLLARGHRNAQMAAELGLSVVTVRHHVSAVLSKLDARSRTQAAAMALQAGIA